MTSFNSGEQQAGLYKEFIQGNLDLELKFRDKANCIIILTINMKKDWIIVCVRYVYCLEHIKTH